MDVANLYVPQIEKWTKYYDKVANGSYNSYTDHMDRGVNQRGGSIAGSADGFMVPIDKHAKNQTAQIDNNQVSVQMVSPAQMTTEQAKQELRRSVKNPEGEWY